MQLKSKLIILVIALSATTITTESKPLLQNGDRIEINSVGELSLNWQQRYVSRGTA